MKFRRPTHDPAPLRCEFPNRARPLRPGRVSRPSRRPNFLRIGARAAGPPIVGSRSPVNGEAGSFLGQRFASEGLREPRLVAQAKIFTFDSAIARAS